jgi:YbbR domain-containing protein
VARVSRRAALRSELWSYASKNAMYKLLSLLFAVSIWAWVQTEQVVDKRFRARVFWSWPDTLVRVQEVPKTLVVTIQGPQGLVQMVQRRKLRYDVDLSEAELGTVSVDFSTRTLAGMPEGVSVVQVSPPALDIELDRRLEREVRVQPIVIGDVDSGWRLDAVRIEPQKAVISGPHSLVRTMAEVSTDVIDLDGLQTSTTYEVDLAIKERTISVLNGESVRVTVEVSPIIVEKTYNEVPVMSRAEGWKAVPGTAIVTLTGNANDMRQLSPDQVSVQVHLPDVVPIGRPLDVSFDPKAPRQGLEVVHQGPGSVTVLAVVPGSVRLERIP